MLFRHIYGYFRLMACCITLTLLWNKAMEVQLKVNWFLNGDIDIDFKFFEVSHVCPTVFSLWRFSETFGTVSSSMSSCQGLQYKQLLAKYSPRFSCGKLQIQLSVYALTSFDYSLNYYLKALLHCSMTGSYNCWIPYLMYCSACNSR